MNSRKLKEEVQLRNKKVFIDCFAFAKFERGGFEIIATNIISLMEKFTIIAYCPEAYYRAYKEFVYFQGHYKIDKMDTQILAETKEIFTLLKEPGVVALFMSDKCAEILEKHYPSSSAILSSPLITRYRSFADIEGHSIFNTT